MVTMSPKSGEPKIHKVRGMDISARFEWSVGELMESFMKKLAGKNILGAECPDCGHTHVPPRSRCVKCHSELKKDNLADLPGKGTLVSYTTAFVELDGKGNLRDLEEPQVIGSVKLEGADSPIVVPIKEIDPKDVKEGIEVEVEWRDETKGEIGDIKYFKPVKS